MTPAQEPLDPVGKKNIRVPAPLKNAGNQGAAVSAPPAEANVDLFTAIWLRFGRFGWDIAGVGFIAFAFMTAVGFWNRGAEHPEAQGFFLTPWVKLVAQGFGWGWPVAALAIALVGLLLLRRRFTRGPAIPLGRVLALEGFAFALLALLAVFGGWSLENAEAGLDGGVIGWGLAVLIDYVLPPPWSAIALVALLILLGAVGSGLAGWLLHRLEAWLDVVNPAGATNTAPEVLPEPPAAPESEDIAPPSRTFEGRDPTLPPLTLLLDEQTSRPEESLIQETAQKIEHTLAEFGVPAHVRGYRVGPTITQYAVEPGFLEKAGPEGETIRQKVRVSQISALSRDLALALSAERLRIEAPVPGRSYVGIEVPNQLNAVVRMRGLIECEAFTQLHSPLAVALGRDVSGQPLVADLARMPHLLIAGTTGSGKSICIAALASCLALNNHPSDLRMAMLDPKMVELMRFNALPHLYGRVETELERMLGVLRWAIMEMEHRYKLLESSRARDIVVFNQKMAKRGQPTLPRIVIFIDELADLMMTAPDQTEHSLIRLAQMARATGIHLVVATQRPSTDVVTGLIKANFPARLAFSVASSIDSRVILDTGGAETLLGRGDMLFLNPEVGTPLRAQGVWVSDGELDGITNFWRNHAAATGASGASAGGPAQPEAAPWEELIQNNEEDSDALVEQAVKIVQVTQRASTSLLQRRLRIGYPRAARLMDELEELGVVGPSQGGGREREVLIDRSDGSDEEIDDNPYASGVEE